MNTQQSEPGKRRIRVSHPISGHIRRVVRKRTKNEWAEMVLCFIAALLTFYFGGGVSRGRGLLFGLLAAGAASTSHHLNDYLKLLVKWVLSKFNNVPPKLKRTIELCASVTCAVLAVLLGHALVSHTS